MTRPSERLLSVTRPAAPAAPGGEEPAVGVLLADHDPISRHVLGSLLGRAPMIDLRSCVDSLHPPENWPLDGVQVVVLSVAREEDTVHTLHRLSARRVRTLLLGTRWSRSHLAAAFAAGVGGVLVKQANTEGLVPGIRAVSAGHQVLSPELFDLCRGAGPTRRGHGVGHGEPGPGTAGVPGGSGAVRPPGPPRGPQDPGLQDGPGGLLTPREREVLDLLAQGATTGEAALALAVSPATVKSHVSHALAKLGARNRLEAVLLLRAGELVVPAHPAR